MHACVIARQLARSIDSRANMQRLEPLESAGARVQHARAQLHTRATLCTAHATAHTRNCTHAQLHTRNSVHRTRNNHMAQSPTRHRHDNHPSNKQDQRAVHHADPEESASRMISHSHYPAHTPLRVRWRASVMASAWSCSNPLCPSRHGERLVLQQPSVPLAWFFIQLHVAHGGNLRSSPRSTPRSPLHECQWPP